MIQPTSIVYRNDELVSVEMDDEIVMMNIDAGSYFALDPTGRHIWELIAEPASVAGLIETMVGEFDIDADTCADDTLGFLNDLLRLDIIKVIDERSP